MMNIIYKDGTHEDLTLCLLTSGHERAKTSKNRKRRSEQEAGKRGRDVEDSQGLHSIL